MARIFVIEDKPLMADLSKVLLEAEGHEVKTAVTIDEAEALFSDITPNEFPQVIFSDANLEQNRKDAEHGNRIIRLAGSAALQLGVELDYVSISGERTTEIYDLPSLRNEFPNLRIHSAEKSPHAIAELASRLAA